MRFLFFPLLEHLQFTFVEPDAFAARANVDDDAGLGSFLHVGVAADAVHGENPQWIEGKFQ